MAPPSGPTTTSASSPPSSPKPPRARASSTSPATTTAASPPPGASGTPQIPRSRARASSSTSPPTVGAISCSTAIASTGACAAAGSRASATRRGALIDAACHALERALARSPHGRLGTALKQRCKRLIGYTGRFERSAAASAEERLLDGVICGHVHKAESRRIGRVHYLNDGDWVQSCTALVEHHDGRFELVHAS